MENLCLVSQVGYPHPPTLYNLSIKRREKVKNSLDKELFFLELQNLKHSCCNVFINYHIKDPDSNDGNIFYYLHNKGVKVAGAAPISLHDYYVCHYIIIMS